MRTTIAGCALPGLLLGVCFAATAATPQHSAVDAKTGKLLRAPTAQERSSMAKTVAARQRTLKQPRTEAEAKPTLRNTPNGTGATMQVPTNLWSSLAVQRDAQGNLRVREYEGNEPAPVLDAEEVK
ncbi:hypothetical protein M2650_10420 [Luteimonas sp. SX5]|uniref:Secreted protein n=1 Tax=Luteimonas galliterrae TaxID=2940486 RepID=A0ABT0MJK2_9GAMM|nr:hypothetical protein [Luteimonas galliterrae]MCL1635043.1 hypothetical protein [Luteimonas galliterrae]